MLRLNCTPEFFNIGWLCVGKGGMQGGLPRKGSIGVRGRAVSASMAGRSPLLVLALAMREGMPPLGLGAPVSTKAATSSR